MPRFGIPANSSMVKCNEFKNAIFHHLEQLIGVSCIRTPLYNPASNDQYECMNQNIIVMLRTVDESRKYGWNKHHNQQINADNFSRNSAKASSHTI